MHLARAFKRHAVAVTPAPPQHVAWLPSAPGLLVPPCPATAAAAPGAAPALPALASAAPARPFRHLSPAEQL
jgi:hypothetical protein